MDETGTNPKQKTCRFINTLPDELLQTILEKLPVEEAVRTGVLSNRWKNLWKYISKINFEPPSVYSRGKKVASFLNNFIRLHQGPKIQEFCVEFNYQSEMSSYVDSWVLFAVKKHVEELHLDFDPYMLRNEPCYQLHPSVFNCQSLTRLKLFVCDLKLPPSVQLQSLQMLQLYGIELPENAIQTITSGTPLLERLILTDCNTTRDLYISVAANPHFSVLTIYESFFVRKQISKLVIKAPTAIHLEFAGFMLRSEYVIEDISCCSEANFSFDDMFDVCGEVRVNILANNSQTLHYENLLQGFLLSCQKVDDVNLCNWIIQMLSLRELRNLEEITLYHYTVEIFSSFQKWELPGIIYVLRSCPYLEELIIQLNDGRNEIKLPEEFMKQHDFLEDNYLAKVSQTRPLSHRLEYLTTVHFKKLEGNYQTWKEGHFEMQDFFDANKFGLDLVTFLTVTAANLESMVFETGEQRHQVCF